jgi:ABC-2 type transport system ATP-binding protein
VKHFGDVVALDGVGLDVEPGEVHALVGPNGAGKTTLLGSLLGLSGVDGGELEVLGARVMRRTSVPEGVAGFVDGPALYPSLTARRNLGAVAAFRGRPPSVVDEALEQVGLGDVADDRVGGFSLGMRQRLGLAAALLVEPRLLVLDEPTNGLDPAGKRHVHRVLRDLAAAGVAVVLSSHRTDDLAAVCSEATILSGGRVVFTGSLRKLAAESPPLDHRIATTDRAATVRLACSQPGLRVLRRDEVDDRLDDDAVVVRGPMPAVDRLVGRLVEAGVALRELAPLVSPLEAAYLALTDEAAERLTREDEVAW